MSVKYPTGPRCGPVSELGLGECPYRKTSIGYAPETGPTNSEFLFLLERLGKDEVEAGRNAVGGTGRTFNRLLQQYTPINRSEQCLANTIRCRPVVWEGSGKEQKASRRDNGDYIDDKVSPGMIRECGMRYGDALLQRFTGSRIIALGKIAAQYMTERPLRISKYRGTIFEPGTLVECEVCGGSGILPGKEKKCGVCKGTAVAACAECGRRKHLKKCTLQILASCACCENGKTRSETKPCKTCEGSGKVPSDPDNPHVCSKLKPGQLLFLTYHPAMLIKQPTMEAVVGRDFSRFTNMAEELVQAELGEYHYYPPVEATSDLLAANRVSLDIETSGSMDPTLGNMECIGATHRPHYGVVLDAADGRIAELLCRPEIVGQNFILYDWWWLAYLGYVIPESTKIWDTRFAGKLLNPDTPNDLYFLVGEFARPPIRGYWKSKQAYATDKAGVALIDVDATLRVRDGQYDALVANGQLHIMEDYIMPLSKVVFEMRRGGMRIDKTKMEGARERILRGLAERRLQLPDWGGTRTEGQHAKAQDWLYNHLKLPVQKKRDTGRPTAGHDALEELVGRLATNHPSIRHLSDEEIVSAQDFISTIQYCRDFSKLESAFLRYKISPEEFIHPELNPCGAGTFRFTCREPNAQQVPDCTCDEKNSPCGASCVWGMAKLKCSGECTSCLGARYIFLPDEPGWEIMSADLSQAEVVGFLWYAEEWDILRRVLHEGMDAHQMVANKILGRDATKPERDAFKTTTFALLYGEHERTTAARLHKPLEEIQSARQFYFKMLPGVPEYRRMMTRSAMDRGFVESPFGIRRYMYLEKETGRAANQAANAPIQNIPPMILGKAMIRLRDQLPKPARLWMQVHDEILLTYPREMRSIVAECVTDNMRTPVKEMSASPIKMASGLVFNSDIEVGPNWGMLKKLEVRSEDQS